MIRLKQASYQLVYQCELAIIDIALQASFENPESFSRVFKKVFSITTSPFRQKPQWQSWHKKLLLTKKVDRNFLMNKDVVAALAVEIINFKETKVAVFEHRGSPVVLNDSISHFIEWRKNTGLFPVEQYNTYGVAYDDPTTTITEDFRFDICGEVHTNVPDNPQGVISKTIPAGRCAKFDI